MKFNILTILLFTGALLMACSSDKEQVEGLYIKIDAYNSSFKSDGTSNSDRDKNLLIKANVAWKIESNAHWVTTSITEGNGDATIQLVVAENKTTEPRNTTLTIIPDPSIKMDPLEVEVKQEGINPDTNILTQIQDPEFRRFCAAFDTNNDGKLTASEAAMVTKIKINSDYKQIQSMDGIAYFGNLQSLYIADLNELTHLELKNPKLEEITLLGNKKLEQLDLSNLPKLKEIEFKWTELKQLIIGDNPSIERLKLEENLALKELQMGNNPSITHIHCNLSPIEKLNVEQIPKLKQLTLFSSNLVEIAVQKCSELEELTLIGHKINRIDINQNTKLKNLGYGNAPTQVLDLTKNRALQTLYLTNLPIKQLNLEQNQNLTQIVCTENDLENLVLSNHPKLDVLRCYNNKINTLELELNNLTELSCQKNMLTELDVTKLPKLSSLSAGENKLTTLDLSSLQNLQYFHLLKSPTLTTIYINQAIKAQIDEPNTAQTFHYDTHTELIVK